MVRALSPLGIVLRSVGPSFSSHRFFVCLPTLYYCPCTTHLHQRSLCYCLYSRSYWEGIKIFESKYHAYLQSQIGNPDGPDKPNKKYYDPRQSLRSAEVQTVMRLEKSFEDLKCQKILGLGEAQDPQNVLGPRRGALPV
jgi:hypothetical protein